MLKGAIGRRYARAVFDIAVERNDADGWLSALVKMREFLTHSQVAALMDNPKLTFESKKEIVDRGLPTLDAAHRNLLHLLVAKRRTDIVDSICDELERMINDYRGTAHADVTTAVPLNDAEARAVADKLSQITGKRVELRVSIDQSIIGGLIARVGDTLIDGSVRGRLIALKQRLVGTAV